MTNKFRIISLSAGALILANPANPKHELRVTAKRSDRTIGATNTQLVRLDISENLPATIVDGSGNKIVLENMRVGFTRYLANDKAAFIEQWTRLKANVDAIIADGGLEAFTPNVDLIADSTE